MTYKICAVLILLTYGAVAQPKKPTITGQKPLIVNEDESITIQLSDLIVSDPDNPDYPTGFTLKISQGQDYTLSGTTITPRRDFSGTLSVKVTVSDGKNESNKYNLLITVLPINDPPVIVRQVNTISTLSGTTVTIKPSDIEVSDPDDNYPNDFTMTIQPGSHYTVSGNVVTPSAGFTGKLSIGVLVNDGAASSAVFNMTLTVEAGNKPPVIIGQYPVSVAKGKTFTIVPGHLKVEDPDNTYPQDFTVIVHEGVNYSFSGTQVTPPPSFTGILLVRVAVSDGTLTSEVYNLQVDVKDELTITGQDPIEINEDEAVTLSTSQLKVYDPAGQYPTGYSIGIANGPNYTASGSTITPSTNFHGLLQVTVSVSNGSFTSRPFVFSVFVKPVNDPPSITNFPTTPLSYSIADGPMRLLSLLNIEDPDDTELMLAEIAISPGFEPGNEVLSFVSTDKIKGVFDSGQGILSLVGQATLAEYQAALANVFYDYLQLENSEPIEKTLYVKLSDGESMSEVYQREMTPGENFELDIPTVFTPNDDLANDTWNIRPRSESAKYNQTIIRVYSKSGRLIFETKGFAEKWNGQHNGQQVPSGVYFYTIDFNLGYSTQRLAGIVSVVR